MDDPDTKQGASGGGGGPSAAAAGPQGTRVCRVCGTRFACPPRAGKKAVFCSDACRQKAWRARRRTMDERRERAALDDGRVQGADHNARTITDLSRMLSAAQARETRLARRNATLERRARDAEGRLDRLTDDVRDAIMDGTLRLAQGADLDRHRTLTDALQTTGDGTGEDWDDVLDRWHALRGRHSASLRRAAQDAARDARGEDPLASTVALIRAVRDAQELFAAEEKEFLDAHEGLRDVLDERREEARWEAEHGAPPDDAWYVAREERRARGASAD